MGVKCLNPTQLPYDINLYEHTITALEAMAGYITIPISEDVTKIINVTSIINNTTSNVIITWDPPTAAAGFGIYYQTFTTAPAKIDFFDMLMLWEENFIITYQIWVKK